MLKIVYFRPADFYLGRHPPYSLELSGLPTFLLLITEISGAFWAFQFPVFHINMSDNEGVSRALGYKAKFSNSYAQWWETNIQAETFNLHKCLWDMFWDFCAKNERLL